MTATNHALTGAVVAAVMPVPLLAMPLALVSHIVIDALPHYADDAIEFSDKKFKLLLGLDIFFCILIAGAIFIIKPDHWFLLVACAFLATLPDALWLPDFLASRQGKPLPKYGRIRQFLSDVQWSQKRIGVIMEIVWFGALLFILSAHFL